jgi:hypothetical protein
MHVNSLTAITVIVYDAVTGVESHELLEYTVEKASLAHCVETKQFVMF